MARRKNTRPTTIYCLVDMRPETIADGWPGGKPFYVGKTVQGVGIRFLGHRADASRHPNRKVGPALLACGEHVRIYELETVPVDTDWSAREKFWIAHVRIINPDCANISDGGFGMVGYIATEETRRKQSTALRGKKLTPEQIEKIRQRAIGRTHGPEARRKVSEASKGRVKSPETCEKLRLANLGKKHSAESRAKMSATQTGRKRQPMSEETKRKIGDRHRGRKHTAEFCQRISERQRGKKHTLEHCAKIAESHKGKVFSEERRRNISEALKNRGARMRESRRTESSTSCF